MAKREKRLKKAIESLEKQKEKHLEKIGAGGRKDTTIDYWKKEIEQFDEEIEKKKKKLKKI